MIRRFLILILMVCAIIGILNFPDHFNKDAALSAYNGCIELMGQINLTPEIFMIGTRTSGGRGYFGEYLAEPEGKSGTDTVFGGTSLNSVTVYLTAQIDSEQGSAEIILHESGTKRTLEPDDDGNISLALSWSGGSNYISVVYDNFTGRVMLWAQDGE